MKAANGWGFGFHTLACQLNAYNVALFLISVHPKFGCRIHEGQPGNELYDLVTLDLKLPISSRMNYSSITQYTPSGNRANRRGYLSVLGGWTDVSWRQGEGLLHAAAHIQLCAMAGS